MCASSRRPSLNGNAPMGTTTGIDRWWSSPMRKWSLSDPPTGFPAHKAVSPARSAVARTRHKCASRGLSWHPPALTAGPGRESPYARASPAAPTDKPQRRARSRGTSVGRTPWHDTARCSEMFAPSGRHDNARRSALMCSKADNPSAARTASPSVPMKLRHPPPGSLHLRARKHHQAHAHGSHAERRRDGGRHERRP